ncbi:MAG: PKD domain-containing protein [Vicinamibacteria bacterium]|nr:PKD domain-containing protein [Vicinamibacteria bacterium]
MWLLALAAPSLAAADPAACERRATAWEAFGQATAAIDWRQPAWPARSREAMQGLWRDGESGLAACRAESRPWTDAAYALVATSFLHHQPTRVPAYADKLRGLVREVVTNLRHEAQRRRAQPATTSSTRPEPGLRVARLGYTDTFPLLVAAQSVPPHCIPKPLPDVRDCRGEFAEVKRWFDCYVDNLNDIAHYSEWEQAHGEGLQGEAAATAWNALGVPLDGALGVAHGAVSTASAAMEGDVSGVLFGLGDMATSAAQTATATTIGLVLDAVQLQGNAMMLAIESSGQAQARGQVRFARQRALECRTEMTLAEVALNQCLFEREAELARRELVEMENAGIAMDPSCHPPAAQPPAPPSPEEEARRRREREEVEKRVREAEARLRSSDARVDDPPKPPPRPPVPPVPPRGLPHLDSFFDIFHEVTAADLERARERAKRGSTTRPPDSKRGPGKAVLIGGGAALLGGAVALAGGGGSSTTSPVGGGTSGPPPAVNLNINPSGRGLAGLTSFAFAGSGSATSWEWAFGDGITGSGQNVNHTYAGGGRFSVTLTGRNAGGSATATGSVEVGRPMTGSWAGPFNNRNVVITFSGAGPTLSGSYADQFDQGTIAGQISSGASFVCPCDVLIEITLARTQFRFEGQRVGDQLVGAFVGSGFRTEATLSPQ